MRDRLTLLGLGILLTCGASRTPQASAQYITDHPAQGATTPAQLRLGFSDPPPPARLRCYWWWLNGNTDAPTITHDLEQMAAMGYGGAILVDAGGADQNGNRPVPAGPRFGTPAWTKLYLHALREADRLGLEISLNIQSGWNLGGPGVKPEDASKILTWSRKDVRGGRLLELTLTAPATHDGFYREIAVLAYPLHRGVALPPDQPAKSGPHSGNSNGNALRYRIGAAETGFSMPDSSSMVDPGPKPDDTALADASLAEVQNLTDHVRNNKLTWQAPGGDWEILRIGYTASGALVSTSSSTWKGLAIDYLDHRAFDRYWDQNMQPLLEAAKPYLGRSLRYLVTDSWELGGANWTADFREQFQRRRGYDPVPYLPTVAGRIVQDRGHTTRFLDDLRRTVADLVTEEHYDVFAAHARAYGLGIHPESGGPHGAPLDALETFRGSAFPQTEYWAPNAHRATDRDRFFTKEAASAANIYGKPFVAQEGMTTVGPQWNESLANDLKPAFDRAITEGMNRLFWHEFTSSPARMGMPGQEYFAGTHANPNVTWWSAAHDFFAYLNRVQFLMQQGTPVNDVLYDYGDNVPNFVRVKSDDPAHVLPGYDYDVTNEDALLHTLHDDGTELVGPTGSRWRLLVLPSTRRLTLTSLRRVAAYLEGGGAVAGLPLLGATGNQSPADQSAFNELSSQLFAGCTEGQSRSFGKGTLICTQDGRKALAMLHVAPDFESTSPAVDYIHRRNGSTDIYFIRNTTASAIDTTLTLRVPGGHAQLWDAVTGEAQPLAADSTGQATRVSVHLAAHGSSFVLLDPSFSSPGVPSPHAPSRLIATLQHWTLSFQQGRGAPVEPQQFNDLQSWSASTTPGIRYFSGTATYTTQFTLSGADASRGVLLQLTDVHELARVFVNGKLQGTIWAHPYSLALCKDLHAGANELRIEVSNDWANRLIGDAQPGVTQPITHTNISAYKADSPLLPSGLIGAVTIHSQP
ncbi:glycosyl hydrolase [Bryocella elongata]|uniref:glycosyl hydrolase n=1 Tax=Bryocella elongata TaxID=863522 RepID=UPI001356B556|nr:glycosyl hydrolase [Bryocella elongata]